MHPHLTDNKEQIRRAFSASARNYASLSALQGRVGDGLLKFVKPDSKATSILDVGMGPGLMTGKLVTCFPGLQVIGMDFADGMIEQAKKNRRGFNVVQADAIDLPFRNDVFDVIFSNLAYQWVSDLDAAFKENFRCLKTKAQFCFSTFVYESLAEVFEALEKTNGHKRTEFKRLARCADVLAAVKRSGFRVLKSRQERILLHFNDLFAVLNWLKGIGAHRLNRNVNIGKDWLARANGYLIDRQAKQKKIVVGFEVLLVSAQKK